MGRGLWRTPVRVAAIIAGIVLPLLTCGLVLADLPGGIPAPPGLPASGQPITIVVEPPSLVTVAVPVDPEGCAVDLSYDNTQANPLGSVFRGQTACGSGVYQPTMGGHAVLTDIFGNQVASGSGAGGRGDGPITSQGDYTVNGSPTSVASSPGVSGTGAVPGMEYTITYTTSITLTWPQYWGPAAAGCSISGQTMTCTGQTTYSFIPGTQGGFTPS